MSLEVDIRGTGGLSVILSAEPSWSVRDVKLKVEAQKGIALHFQALSAGARRLSDLDLLSSVACQDNRLSLSLQRRTTEQVHWLSLLEGKTGLEKLEHAPECIRADSELMLLAAGRDAEALKHAHQRLLGSCDFMLAAAKRNGESLQWATKALWSNHEFVLGAFQVSWRWFQSASEELLADRDFVLQAAGLNRWALQCASEELKADKEFVELCLSGGKRQYIMAQMRDDGLSLRRASTLRNDKEIVSVAVNSKGAALEYAAPELQADRSIVMQAVSNDPMALQWADPKLQGDRGIAVAALEKDGRAAEWVPQTLLADKTVSGYASVAKRPPVPRRRASTSAASLKDPYKGKKVTEVPGSKSSDRTMRRPASAGAGTRRAASAGTRRSLGGVRGPQVGGA